MDIINIYIITAKISGLIIFGYIISKAFNQDLSRKIIKYIINLLWYILIPVFVISSVWGSDIYGISAGYVAGGAVFAVSAGILISFLISKKKGIPFKDIALPVAFMNSGYLGLSLNKLVFNDAALAPAAVYNAVVAVLIFTVGIVIAGKSFSVKNILKVPVIYALFIGLMLNFSGIKPVMFSGGYIVNTVPYLMLIYVGYNLRNIKKKEIDIISEGVLARIFGGLAAGTLFILVFKPGILASRVIMFSSALPTALSTIVISKRYNLDTGLSGGMITVSTVCFMVVMPFIVKFIYYIV